jgi:hypothetical protein
MEIFILAKNFYETVVLMPVWPVPKRRCSHALESQNFVLGYYIYWQLEIPIDYYTKNKFCT